jgi:heme/copper-type cytochrome/quinol oxidase subunit 4
MEEKIDYSADAAVAVGGYSLVLLLLPVITLGLVAVVAVVDDVADALLSMLLIFCLCVVLSIFTFYFLC